jgi:hypothetical protein
MLAKSGLKSVFHLMISIVMGAVESARKVATDYVLVIDHSGSTGSILNSGASILDTAKDAGQKVVDNLDPGDRIAIVGFSPAHTVLNLTTSDNAGKAKAGNALYALPCDGGTEYAPALKHAMRLFGTESNRKKVIIMFTDGQDFGPDPLPICTEIKEAGITLFVGGLGVNNEGEKLLDSMAGANFKSLNTADEVTAFFADAQAQAAMAAVTNAQLRITPVTFAQVMNFEKVTRGGKPDYVPADASSKLIPIGDIAVSDRIECYLSMNVVLPEDIKPGRRAFGKIELVGDVPSEGTKAQVLCSTPIAVQFSATAVPGMNEAVKDMINLAAASRETYKYAQTGDASHLAAARKTVGFSQAEAAKALAAQLASIQAQAAQDPDAAAKQARRATKGFSAAEAAEALKKLKKN